MHIHAIHGAGVRWHGVGQGVTMPQGKFNSGNRDRYHSEIISLRMNIINQNQTGGIAVIPNIYMTKPQLLRICIVANVQTIKRGCHCLASVSILIRKISAGSGCLLKTSFHFQDGLLLLLAGMNKL